MDGHSTRNYGSTKKRVGVPGVFTIEHPRPRSVQKKAPALQSAIRLTSVRKGPFTSSPAPVGAPARAWPLLTGLCDSHRCSNSKSKRSASVRKGPLFTNQ